MVSRDPCRIPDLVGYGLPGGQKHLPEHCDTVRDLNYQLKQLCRHNRDGGYATQRNRERLLSLIADQLHALGFRGMGAQSLKPKHVESLVNRWQAESLSVGTIKNRMTVLRWWAQKVNRQNVIARQNDHYGIPDRVFVSTDSKARQIDGAVAQDAGQPREERSLRIPLIRLLHCLQEGLLDQVFRGSGIWRDMGRDQQEARSRAVEDHRQRFRVR